MREVYTIKINPDSDFAKSAVRQDDPEAAALAAAERARREVQDRLTRQEAERKSYADSLRYLDKIEFKNEKLRRSIGLSQKILIEYKALISEEYDVKVSAIKELQKLCEHKEVIEQQTSYKDEYDDWHSGHWERKCIECFLVEESSYHTSSRAYGGTNKYSKLEKATPILLRKIVDGKEYQLEFDDLKW